MIWDGVVLLIAGIMLALFVYKIYLLPEGATVFDAANRIQHSMPL